MPDGVYYCHRCNASGRVSDRKAQSGRISQGVEYSPRQSAQPKANPRPRVAWQKRVRSSLFEEIKDSPAESYLAGRGLNKVTIRNCGLYYAPRFFDSPAVLFPIRNESGVAIATQGRFISVRGNALKAITVGPKKRGLFLTPGALDHDIVITEAPIDALSLWQMGYAACATCGGGRLPEWFTELCRGRKVGLASDADEAGEKLAAGWKSELVGAATQRMRPPSSKDWNEELMSRSQGAMRAGQSVFSG